MCSVAREYGDAGVRPTALITCRFSPARHVRQSTGHRGGKGDAQAGVCRQVAADELPQRDESGRWPPLAFRTEGRVQACAGRMEAGTDTERSEPIRVNPHHLARAVAYSRGATSLCLPQTAEFSKSSLYAAPRALACRGQKCRCEERKHHTCHRRLPRRADCLTTHLPQIHGVDGAWPACSHFSVALPERGKEHSRVLPRLEVPERSQRKRNDERNAPGAGRRGSTERDTRSEPDAQPHEAADQTAPSATRADVRNAHS